MASARLPVSRRGLLALAAAGGAAALAGCSETRPPAGPPEPTGAPPPAAAAAVPPSPLPVFLPRDASREFRAVADALVESMRQARIPGAALGILADKQEQHATFGVDSLALLRPVGPDTLFQIGSLTKIYTATAVWRLVDQGTLGLDEPVRRYLRGLRLRDEHTAATVTVGNLLDHTAGWYGDEVVDTGDDPGALGRYVDTRMPDLPQLFECGKFFSYNNAAFTLLGRLVETAANTDFNDAMQRLVIGPLGLGATVLEHDAVFRRPSADGHTAARVDDRDTLAVQTPVWLPRSVDPAGGLWSTTRDIVRFARLHLGEQPPGRGALLRPETLRAMQQPVVDVPGLDLKMGRSWFVQDIDGLRVISHNGDTPGQHTVFVAVPQRRFAFVLLFNGQPAAGAGLAALDAAFSHYPGLAPLTGRAGLTRALTAPRNAERITLSGRDLDGYAGDYVDPGMTTRLVRSGSGLNKVDQPTPVAGTWRPPLEPPPPPPSPVTFLAPDSAVAADTRLPFVRNEAGDVGWIADGLRLRPRA